MDADPRVAELIQHALRLEGLNRHASTHAAGVVIGNRPLVDYLPLYRGQNGELVTQFAMKSVESIGLIKFDFLGLKTLTVIKDAQRLVNAKVPGGVPLDVDALPLDDPKVYELLGRGETTGVFQLESSGMKELMIKLRPSTFEDIIALVALYRPGPLGSGMVDDFIRRKHGEIPIEYELPELEPILRDTYGVIVYQEQVMQIAQVLADYSLGRGGPAAPGHGQEDRRGDGQAEVPLPRRRAPQGRGPGEGGAHLRPDGEVRRVRLQQVALGGVRPRRVPDRLPQGPLPGGVHGGPAHQRSGNTDKVVKDIAECRDMGIPVLPPDINESDIHFTVAGEGIRFGLAAVKNVGEAAVESILAERREGGGFRGLLDCCERVDLQRANRKVIESLIQCGAFDSLGGNRAQYLAYLDRALERAAVTQRDRARGQTNLLDLLSGAGGEPEPTLDDLPDLPAPQPSEQLRAEKEVLGMFLSGHPLGEWASVLETYTDGSLAEVWERPDRSQVTVGGMAASLKVIPTKTGNRMAFLTLEDAEGTGEVVVFPDVYARCEALLQAEVPLIVRGTLERSEDSGKILAEEILPLSEAPERLTRSVHIQINAALHGRTDLEALRRILGEPEHRGSAPGFLHILLPEKVETVVRLPEGMSLRASARLKGAVRGLIGNDAAIAFK